MENEGWRWSKAGINLECELRFSGKGLEMKVRLCLVGISVFLTLFSTSCEREGDVDSAEAITLRLNLPKGYSAVVRTTSDGDYTHSMGQNNYQSKTHFIISKYFIECVDVDPSGIMTIKQTHKTVKVRNESKGETFEYDSTKPAVEGVSETDRFAGMAAGINKSITMLPKF